LEKAAVQTGGVHAEFIPLIGVSPLACILDFHVDESHRLVDFVGGLAASAGGVINRSWRSLGQKLNVARTDMSTSFQFPVTKAGDGKGGWPAPPPA